MFDVVVSVIGQRGSTARLHQTVRGRNRFDKDSQDKVDARRKLGRSSQDALKCKKIITANDNSPVGDMALAA